MNTFVSDILDSETQINSLLNNGRFGSDVSALIENFRGSGAPNNVISRMRDKEIANRNRYNMNNTKRTQDYFKWANEHIQKGWFDTKTINTAIQLATNNGAVSCEQIQTLIDSNAKNKQAHADKKALYNQAKQHVTAERERMLFVLSDAPELNLPQHIDEKIITFSHRGKAFPITESTVKRFGEQFRHHIGKEGAYFYVAATQAK